jgi:hypothetical protein
MVNATTQKNCHRNDGFPKKVGRTILPKIVRNTSCPRLPDGIFSYQKSPIRYILEWKLLLYLRPFGIFLHVLVNCTNKYLTIMVIFSMYSWIENRLTFDRERDVRNTVSQNRFKNQGDRSGRFCAYL